jgi:ABC-2 type transport system ATP-binding protein
LSDRISIIDKGRLLVVGTVENIKNQLGQGDFFEIELAENYGLEMLPFLKGGPERFRVQGRTLQLVSHNAADILPQVLQVIKERGLHLENLRIRKKNLEDVFISLTGRGLRQ